MPLTWKKEIFPQFNYDKIDNAWERNPYNYDTHIFATPSSDTCTVRLYKYLNLPRFHLFQQSGKQQHYRPTADT